MRNKNIIALVVGIGLFGLFVIFMAWSAMSSHNPQNTQDTVYGFLSLPEAISRFEADGANGLVAIEPDKQTARLPAGRYNVRYWKTERKDESGNDWALVGQYYGQNNPFEVKDGDETKLDVGEPIIATVEARNVGSSYAFNQVITGRHQEIIELTRNGSRPQPPKLHIRNKDGSYEQTFSFQYG